MRKIQPPQILVHEAAASASAVQMVGHPVRDEVLAGAGCAVEAEHQRLAGRRPRAVMGAQYRDEAVEHDVLAVQRGAQVAAET